MKEKHDHESGPHDHPHKDEHDDCCGYEHQHEHGAHNAAPESIALNPDAKGNLETTLRIAGMDCADEVEALEQVFRPLKGVREVPIEQVVIGSIIAVKSGSRIPLDGVVASGESSVNQAPITGESMPVDKKTGDVVFAGTINGRGALEIRTTKGYADTTIAKIIHLVEEAQSQKAPSERFVDVFARYYTPAVMLAALFVMLAPPLLFGGAWPVWFYRGLVLLVIACPCALVISTPVSVVSGLTAMARRGVLIKGGAVLEAVGKLRALAMDKTGTITEGKPRVTKVIALNSKTETDILRIAAAIDTHSEHPLAQAVVAYANEKKSSFHAAKTIRHRAVAEPRQSLTAIPISWATIASRTSWQCARPTSKSSSPKLKPMRNPS